MEIEGWVLPMAERAHPDIDLGQGFVRRAVPSPRGNARSLYQVVNDLDATVYPDVIVCVLGGCARLRDRTDPDADAGMAIAAMTDPAELIAQRLRYHVHYGEHTIARPRPGRF